MQIISEFKIKLVVALLLFGLTSCVIEEPEEFWSLQTGDRLPEFSIEMSKGEIITTQSLAGKKSVIIFFTTTCGDCQRELPGFQRWYEDIQASGEDINFICISREEGPEAVASYWEEKGFTMPYSAQNDRKIYNLFATSGVPRVYEADAALIITKVISDY